MIVLDLLQAKKNKLIIKFLRDTHYFSFQHVSERGALFKALVANLEMFPFDYDYAIFIIFRVTVEEALVAMTTKVFSTRLE